MGASRSWTNESFLLGLLDLESKTKQNSDVISSGIYCAIYVRISVMKIASDNPEKCIVKAGLGLVCYAAWLSLFAPLVHSAELSQTKDCSNTDVEAKINSQLSVKENLDLLLKDLDEALRNVKYCEQSNSERSGGSRSKAASGADPGREGTAARGIAGTDGTSNVSGGSGSGPAAKEKKSSGSNSSVSSQSLEPGRQGKSSNGRRPDKLKKNDNDSIFVQQLKAAIADEKDPIARATLVKELKKYEQ